MSFRDIVKAARNDASPDEHRLAEESSSHNSPLAVSSSTPLRKTAYRSQPNTPSMRTGPPHSLYGYSLPNSPSLSRNNSKFEPSDLAVNTEQVDSSDFRSALERNTYEPNDKKGKRRESSLWDESWTLNPKKWFQESPKDEKSQFTFFDGKNEEKSLPNSRKPTLDNLDTTPKMPTQDGLTRSQSTPRDGQSKPSPTIKWSRLRSMLPSVTGQGSQKARGPSVVTSPNVNIADELMAGGLSTLMLRLWFERDEKGRRRVPVLLHRLRIRVSDSLHPLHGKKSVFRIECDYGNGAARWVIYRQLRDFVSLHTHYTFSNAYNRNSDALPEFPRTSIPYFKFLNREKGVNVSQPDFALLQRESLESYLIKLIRAVMFHPSSNRLAGFLEISALSISLAQSGGSQAKAGYLQIEPAGKLSGGFGRKSATFKEKKMARWCAVRESYLVALQESGELAVWDVFLLDSDFKIERPKRYYRQGLNFLHPHLDAKDKDGRSLDAPEKNLNQRNDSNEQGTLRSRLSKVFHPNRLKSTKADGENHGGAVEVPDGADSDSGSSDASSVASAAPAPMLDPSTNANPLALHNGTNDDAPRLEVDKRRKRKRAVDVSKHTFYIENSQMRLKLFARNERQMLQWITALERVALTSHYTSSHRFDSFAPIRLNVAAQWLVDGRDYFWNLSRAILLARETIYIHDWWLSPELQMRRPNKDKYRLDKLLEKKAKEGVKVHIIVYQEVSNRTTPTDSNYTKQRMTSLHPNITVQRSPSHFQTGTFYWAHHEKMCVIDQAIAFMGGLDLCFGRWDTAQHVLVDDPDDDPEASTIWPGKDYSNPRIVDFHALNKPEEDMYDRGKVPRMPWHDVGMQVVGQPARDLARHFVERWNYLLRIKNHSKIMPFLLPPPDFKPGELAQMGLTGTCEMQICRSAGQWSLGTTSRIEHSIQNAYLKAIQMSEHFVYIENQFFITSTVVADVKIENRIGDALVHRIIRAHRESTPWKCCIVIPLLPGFTFPVDHSDASAIRIILECQNRTIARGPNSIFSRLKKEGINPEEYIALFSLRNWGKLRGDVLTTEQVYIHGKVCIVDDRLAIIGSANINERSQRGDRDSELAAVIRDTDMIDCTMAGKPFKVGRFAHTLRVRLMREHIGIDVDAILDDDLMASEPVKPEHEQEEWNPDAEQALEQADGVTRVQTSNQKAPAGSHISPTANGIEQANAAQMLRRLGFEAKDMSNAVGESELNEEHMTYTRDGQKEPGIATSVAPTVEENAAADSINGQAGASATGDKPSDQNFDLNLKTGLSQKGLQSGDPRADILPPGARIKSVGEKTKGDETSLQGGRTLGELYGATADTCRSTETGDEPHAGSGIDDADEQEQAVPRARSTSRTTKVSSKTWAVPTTAPHIDPHGFEDPVSDAFWKNVWVACAVHNTEIYRKVFHAVPDDLITTWKQYKEFVVHHERLNKPFKNSDQPEPVARVPSETYDEDVSTAACPNIAPPDDGTKQGITEASKVTNEDSSRSQISTAGSANHTEPCNDKDAQRRKPARGTEPFEKWEREEMERLLGELRGHLVSYPTHFLEGEDVANNFLFNADRLLPLPIYD